MTKPIGASNPRWLFILSGLVLASAVGLRILSLTRPLYLDELATLDLIGEPTFGGAMQALRADTHHPGYFGLLYLWGKLSCATPWLRLFSLLFDVGSLCLLQRLFVRCAPAAAVAAVGIWGACPVALRNATEIRPYAALSFCTLLSLACAHAMFSSPNRRRWLVSTTAAWVSLVAMHPVGVMAMAAILGALLLPLRVSPPQTARALGAHLRLRGKWLALPTLAGGSTFALLHWWFALDASGARISWMPAMSFDLLARIFNMCFGLDKLASYYASGLFGSSSHPMGLVVFTSALLLGAWRQFGQRAALAALLHVFIVIAFSIGVRPIFWHRSIVPSIMMAVVGVAPALASLPRLRGLAAVVPLLVWQIAAYLPQAKRPIDPCELAGIAAASARAPQQDVLVFPAFMHIAVRPHLQAGAAAHLLSLDQAIAKNGQVGGIALIRGSLDTDEGGRSGTRLLQLLRQKGATVCDWFLFQDENDDLDAPSRTARWLTMKQIALLYGPCEMQEQNARIAHMRCQCARSED